MNRQSELQNGPAAPRLATKFVKFLGVGVIATGFQYVLLVIFVELFAMQKVFASGLSYCLSAVLNYSLNYHFTFRSQADHKKAFIKFALVALVGLGANVGLFGLAHHTLGLHYVVAQLVATGGVLVWNFLANNFWSFK